MTESTPGIWISDPKAYQQKLCDLVGDKDPIKSMAATGAKLRTIVETHDADLLRSRPFEGKWTPCEIIGHMTDGEWTFGFRIRHMLCDKEPKLTGMDQDLWVEHQRHNEREPAELVDMFECLRAYNLVLWDKMEEEDLKKTAVHAERGPESLMLTMRMIAGHDLSHLDQLKRYIEAIKG